MHISLCNVILSRKPAWPSFIAVAILFFAITSAATTAPAGQLLDFKTMQGKWTGFGWFVFGAAERQRARCEAIIQPNGRPDRGSLALKCTSSGLEIDGKAFDITLRGGEASGKWELRSHEITGTLLGNITENSFSMILKPKKDGDSKYGAEFSTKFQDKCHASIQISVRSPIDLKKIDLSIRRC